MTLNLHGEVRVASTPEAAAESCAAWLAGVSEAACRAGGRFTVAVSGGSMCRLLLGRLPDETWRQQFEWPRWHVFFSDERACPPDDEASNYHQVRLALLDQVSISRSNVHRMRGEAADLDAAADEYSTLLAATLAQARATAPRLDCLLLGVGENGHTASLFPSTAALSVTDRWATRGRGDYPPYDRITLTYPTINAAASVALLVTGANKAHALRATAEGNTPVARVRPESGAQFWFLDAAAASAAA